MLGKRQNSRGWHSLAPKLENLCFIFLREALHRLVLIKDDNTENLWKTLFPAPLGPTFSRPFLPRLSNRTGGSNGCRLNRRHMMPRNQSREPNSRDSAKHPRKITNQHLNQMLHKQAILIIMFGNTIKHRPINFLKNC